MRLLQVRADYRDLDGRRRTEAHHLADDIAWLEPEDHLLGALLGMVGGQSFAAQGLRQPRHDLLRQNFAKPVGERRQVYAALLRQLDAQLADIGTTREQHQIVERVVGGLLPGEAHRDVDIMLAGFAANHLQGFVGDALREFEIRPRRSVKAEDELAGVDRGKQIRAKLPKTQAENGRAEHEVNGDHDLPMRNQHLQPAAVNAANAGEEFRMLLAFVFREAETPGDGRAREIRSGPDASPSVTAWESSPAIEPAPHPSEPGDPLVCHRRRPSPLGPYGA